MRERAPQSPAGSAPVPVNHARAVTRRHFLGQVSGGLGALAFASLRADEQRSLLPHFTPRARRVVWLHMTGSPPQQDLFDYKPRLQELHMQPCPESLLKNERFAFIKGHPKILGSPYRFAQYGPQGAWVSELLPCFRNAVEHVTMVRSLFTDQFNHAPAELFLYTGAPRLGRPSLGSWLAYGLGSANRDLPGFVVLLSGGANPSAGKSVWGSGFLPSVYQGCQCRSSGDPVLYVNNPDGIDRDTRRRSLDAIADLNRAHQEQHGDPETASRIEQYELAFRMQMSVPEVMDISRENAATLRLYGAEPSQPSFARNCLLARRLLEQGVRYVQLYDHGWDVHGTGSGDDIITQLPRKCRDVDRGMTALLLDLHQRGLLDDTIVVWSGEFGRTAMNEERAGSKFLGRDHHPHCFTIWVAGGGFRRGHVFGETDELGYRISRDPVFIHDLQATLLHLLGLDHERLTFRFQGRDFRLTDVGGKVVPGLLA